MKAVLLGYGYWGRIIEKHIRRSPDFELCAIFDIDCTESQLLSIEHDSSISAVFICTPATTHYAYCERFLRAKKHVFCEKPTVKSYEEFLKLKELAIDSNTVLYTDYIYTLSNSVKKLKSLIPDIGDVRSIHCDISQFGKFYEGDTVYWVIGVHMLSAVLYLLGEYPQTCECIDMVQDHYGYIHLSFSNNIVSSITCNLLSPVKSRIITIYGSAGLLHFDMLANPTVRWWNCHIGPHGALEEQGKWNYDETGNLDYVLADFANGIAGSSAQENIKISEWVVRILCDLK